MNKNENIIHNSLDKQLVQHNKQLQPLYINAILLNSKIKYTTRTTLTNDIIHTKLGSYMRFLTT